MRIRLISALVAISLPTFAAAQTGSYNYYGTGCPTASPFSVDGVPKLGTAITVKCYGSYSSFFSQTYRLLLTGFSKDQMGGTKLPLYGLGCGPLLTSSELVWLVPFAGTPTTIVSIPFPIPDDSGLVGLSFYQQVLELSRNCGKIGCGAWRISFTRAGHGQIGD